MNRRERLALAARIAAAVLGSLLATIMAVICLALLVRQPQTLGVALAVTVAVPVWVAAMCPGFLARSPARSWLAYLGGSAVLALLAAILAWLR